MAKEKNSNPKNVVFRKVRDLGTQPEGSAVWRSHRIGLLKKYAIIEYKLGTQNIIRLTKANFLHRMLIA